MVDLLDEIQEDLKEEKVLAAIKKYGKLVVIFVMALIIGTAIKLWWNNYKENQAYKEGAQFMTAMKKAQANNIDVAIKEFEELADKGNTNYAALAKLHLGAYYLSVNNLEKAKSFYTSVAEGKNAKELRDYAELMKVKILLSQDGSNHNQAKSELKNYIAANSVFKYSASELLAAIEMNLKDLESANKLIKDNENAADAPESIRERAAQLAKNIDKAMVQKQ